MKKKIGITLAVIALLIALVLFLPVVYSVKVKKKDGFDAAGNVRWLFCGNAR